MNSDELLQHAGWIRRLALQLVRDSNVADDLVQETWLAFLARRPDADRPLRPWLARVLRNQAALRARRAAGRRAREARAAQEEEQADTARLVERAQTSRRLVELVLQLEEPYRSVLLLRFFEELTPAQIAERRGVPSATVRTWLHRALGQLRGRLTEEADGDERRWALALAPLFDSKRTGVGVALPLGAAAVVALLGGTLWGLRGAGEPASAPARVESLEPVAMTSGSHEGDAAQRVLLRDVVPGTRRVRAMDASGEVPLHGLLVEVEGQQLVADAGGWIEVPSGARKALVPVHPGVRVDEMSSHGGRTLRTPAAARVSLPETETWSLDVGPCFELDLVGAEPEGLEARLVSSGLTDYRDDGRARQVARVALAGSGHTTPWVRFAQAPEGSLLEAARWTLEVRSLDGLRWGATAVSDVRSVGVQRVEVKLEATAHLRVHVSAVDTEDERLLTLASPEHGVQLFPAANDSTLDLRWILPGTHALQLESRRHAGISRELVLLGGEYRELDLELTPLRIAGDLSGRIESQTGTYRGQLLVFLRDTEGAILDVFPTTWTGSESLETSFSFQDVPEGEVRLEVLSLADAVQAEGGVRQAHAPESDLRFVLLDDVPAGDWLVAAFDAGSGDEFHEFRFEVELPGGMELSFDRRSGAQPEWLFIAGGSRWNRFPGLAPLRSFPLDGEFQWRLRKDGFATRQGTQVDFESLPGGVRRLRVALLPE